MKTFMKKSQIKYLHLMILWKIQNGLTYMKAMLRTTFSTIWLRQSLQSEKNKSDSLKLIAKKTDFAKEANLDVETIMQEQCYDTVIIDIKNCIKQNEKPERNQKNPYREEKGLKAYIRQFELLFIEDQHALLCINEYNDVCTKSPKICLSISQC